MSLSDLMYSKLSIRSDRFIRAATREKWIAQSRDTFTLVMVTFSQNKVKHYNMIHTNTGLIT